MQNCSSSIDPKHTNTKGSQSTPKLIVVGGTSGIGLALALQHRTIGWQVSVVGHSDAKIAKINSEYPEIKTYPCDLTDLEQRRRLLADLEQTRFDRVIYSSGSYLNERVHQLNKADSDGMLAINLQAFQEVFAWGSQQLKNRHLKGRQIESSIRNNAQPKPSLICIASIAGMMDYPYASLYAKSKRAMIATASAYRLALAPYDIQVTCIASGYIDTQTLRDLNKGNASHKPFIVSLEQAIGHIMQAIEEDIEIAVFPKSLYYLTRILNKLPKPVLSRVLRVKLDK